MDLKRQSEIWLWRPESTGSEESTESASSDDALGPHLKAHSPGPSYDFECPICSRPLRPDSAGHLRRPLASRVAAGERPLIEAELLGIRDDAGPARWRACTVVMRLRCSRCGRRGIAEIPCSMEPQPPQ